MPSFGAFRKSPSGNIEDGRDVSGLLLGVDEPDPRGVAVISTGAGSFSASFSFFEEGFFGFEVFFEAGWKYPRMAFILTWASES